uniref:Uncharacterized protein n=1 Tax=Avena sativa TaxID=4498 RepID=A0ACD6APZ9_AVESA
MTLCRFLPTPQTIGYSPSATSALAAAAIESTRRARIKMSGVDENPDKEDYASLPVVVDEQLAAKRKDSCLDLERAKRPRRAGKIGYEYVYRRQIQPSAPAKLFSFSELVKRMDACTLADLHRRRVDALLVNDPKRNNARVPSRFCSFHLEGFDLDDKSNVPLGPPYEPDLSLPRKRLTEYVTANGSLDLISSSTDVISLRVVKVGPGCAYPVEVYGKVIARDEVDYKCVFIFNRERKDAQLIKSEGDMLALTGPYRPLITLDLMYFEFDLKIMGKHDNEEVKFSQGVIPYYCNPDRNRVILQLPSFKSTVKLVLQRVPLPVAASIEVSVVNEGHDDTIVHYNGKITAGTTKNYRQHMVLYDSSVPSSESLVTRNGSLVLCRNMLAVKGYAEDPDEQPVLYVCFLDPGCEIEDEDMKRPEEEDEEEVEEEKWEVYEEEEEKGEDDEEEEEKGEEDEEEEEKGEEGEEEEEEPKNFVTLKHPLRETVWQYGSPKLKVKVDWTAILYTPKRDDYYQRSFFVPDGYRSPDYRYGGFLESD